MATSASTVTRSDRLDIELREMGCRFVGKYEEKGGPTKLYRYLTKYGKLLFVYDLGDDQPLTVLSPTTDSPHIEDILEATREYCEVP